jgi:hypothetical protein
MPVLVTRRTATRRHVIAFTLGLVLNLGLLGLSSSDFAHRTTSLTTDLWPPAHKNRRPFVVRRYARMSVLYKNFRVHQVFGANTDVGKTVRSSIAFPCSALKYSLDHHFCTRPGLCFAETSSSLLEAR